MFNTRLYSQCSLCKVIWRKVFNAFALACTGPDLLYIKMKNKNKNKRNK